MTRCSICYTVVSQAKRSRRAPSAAGLSHLVLDRIGGCGSYGCKQPRCREAGAAVLVGAGATARLSAMREGDRASLRVQLSGALPWADPMTREEYGAGSPIRGRSRGRASC